MPTISFTLSWMGAFLAFPIGGLLAIGLVGGSTTPLTGLWAGLLSGAVIGLGQWLALRSIWPISWLWIAAVSVGLGVGLATAIATYGPDLSLGSVLGRGLIAGTAIAVLQCLLLAQSVGPIKALIWAVVVSAAWPLGWSVTRAIGVDLSPNFAVFGAAGAITFQIVTLILISILRQQPAPTLELSVQPARQI